MLTVSTYRRQLKGHGIYVLSHHTTKAISQRSESSDMTIVTHAFSDMGMLMRYHSCMAICNSMLYLLMKYKTVTRDILVFPLQNVLTSIGNVSKNSAVNSAAGIF